MRKLKTLGIDIEALKDLRSAENPLELMCIADIATCYDETIVTLAHKESGYEFDVVFRTRLIRGVPVAGLLEVLGEFVTRKMTQDVDKILTGETWNKKTEAAVM